MPRAKKYLDIDVVEAARQRIDHLYSVFDNQIVMFSGGKDSLTVLLLAKEYHEKHGLGPVKTVFRHEEAINPSVLKYVEQYRHYDWCELYWMCLQTENVKLVLDKREPYTEWEDGRAWVTEMPEWAITGKDLGIPEGMIVDQWNIDDYIANYVCGPGSVASMTGVRASESLVRFRSVTQKLNYNYIGSIEHNQSSRVKLCKPIYDWEQTDVLKWILESEFEWCPVYEAQDIAGAGLRVSTAMNQNAAKKFDLLAEIEPEFYQMVIDVFPEMEDQARYWHDFDQDAVIAPYLEKGFNGVMMFINDKVPKEVQPEAKKRVLQWKARYEKDPENYPIPLLLKTIAFGKVHQRLAGVYVDSKSYKGTK